MIVSAGCLQRATRRRTDSLRLPSEICRRQCGLVARTQAGTLRCWAVQHCHRCIGKRVTLPGVPFSGKSSRIAAERNLKAVGPGGHQNLFRSLVVQQARRPRRRNNASSSDRRAAHSPVVRLTSNHVMNHWIGAVLLLVVLSGCSRVPRTFQPSDSIAPDGCLTRPGTGSFRIMSSMDT